MPFATATQEVIPPNTLTKTDLTCGSPRMMCSPSAITCADAPPPIDTDTRALIDEYVVSYERHIPLEEAVAYPAARPLFSDADIARIGAEMAARRQSGGR